MSGTNNDENKINWSKPLNWLLGAMVTAISVMYLDARSDKDFLRQQVKEANQRADIANTERVKADQRTVECHELRATKAESTTEKAERAYFIEQEKLKK